MSEKTAFIGLGVMGYPMAGFLAKAGHKVTVYNRTTSKAEKWVKEYSGELAFSPAEAATGALPPTPEEPIPSISSRENRSSVPV